MGCLDTNGTHDAIQGERWVFDFAIDGDLRFISHRDTLRLFQRAVARASLPVKYSEGFNPHAKLSIPLPRPVGMASQAEAIVIEFKQEIDGDEALHKLAMQMPPFIRLTGARRLERGERLRPAVVRYRLELDDGAAGDIASRVGEVLSSSSVPIERVNHKNGRRRFLDARPLIVDMRVAGREVEFTLRVTSQENVRPEEVAGLLGFEPRAVNHRMRRLEVHWEKWNSGSTCSHD